MRATQWFRLLGALPVIGFALLGAAHAVVSHGWSWGSVFHGALASVLLLGGAVCAIALLLSLLRKCLR